jgi:glycosyltransferase involved in cell wall biosynthesis
VSALRVGVPAGLLASAPEGGHGKVWARTLACLAEQTELVALEGGRWASLLRRRADVVLVDGHAEPPDAHPAVAVIHEVGWHTPELRALLHPQFLAGISERTERSVRAAAGVVVPSASSRRDVLAMYEIDHSRVHTVAYGVDAQFTPGAAAGDTTPGDTAAAPYVLFAAMLHPRKNLDALRGAMALIAREGFTHRLVVAGRPAADGSDVAALERAAAAELPGAPGRVVFLGQVGDGELAALMAGADAYCLPSLYEGFGLTVLEAMACGTPVVVSDRGALPEVVGDAGLVVAPEAEAVAGALRTVLADPGRARALGRAACERAAQFSWKRTAAGWLAALEAAAGSR